ncbi:class I SAM-dependent methyltransferase [Duganella radicis]|uniref:Class I SAM-dependent methyltransferase n=1 Tax=Duganella radicis TaxID=551988 RepID=A0A6L6PRR9_9BURK|nr:class I SAM-dependent methyltransferase [Duganella radicis]MTV41788.1 class I SAM-dependent methyltransferase [Duganella radicis]
MLIQAGALPLTLAVLYVLASFRFPVDYLSAAVAQGLLAALITWKLALARWWRAIQLLFPLAVLTALALHLPSWLFGLGFLLLLGWYWSTFRTQVPYYPSGPAVWDAVRQLLPADGAPRVIDIGSGLGGFVLYLSRVRPDARVSGIELAPLPFFYSWLRARLAGSRARFVRGDYENLDFSQFELVFAYLSPAAMPALWRKAAAEMCRGAMLVSYEFIAEERSPDRILHVTERGVPLYIWYF